MVIPRGVTVTVVFYSAGWSTKAVIVFFLVGDTVRVSSVETRWSFEFGKFEVVLTCIVRCGKCMRSSVVSMNIILFLIKCKPMIGAVSSFITTKCLAKMLSPISKLSVAVDDGFSNCPFAT